MNVDEFVQYIVSFNCPDYPGMYSVQRVQAGSVGRTIARHKNRDAVIVVIPTSHVRANVPVEAPIVEVYIDQRIPQ